MHVRTVSKGRGKSHDKNISICEIAINVRHGNFQESKYDNALTIKFIWRNMYVVPPSFETYKKIGPMHDFRNN